MPTTIKKKSPTTTVKLDKKQDITIADVAEALGVSKSTVSRVLSGNGRISEATRDRVMQYIEENNYSPNVAAKGLANSKTYNIGWVTPGDSTTSDLPFFQRCMIGISQTAAAHDYDLLLLNTFDDDISQLVRATKNKKMDGIVLGRTLVEDKNIACLKESGIPFVVIGSAQDPEVIQIDNDHINACREMTDILLKSGLKRLALIGGSDSHIVNITRRQGFEMAAKEHALSTEEARIYMNADSISEVETALDAALYNHADCIVCMDDRICAAVLAKLKRDDIRIPEQIKVASFYNSDMLENHQPPITSIQYDPKELGSVACATLLQYIGEEEVQRKVLLDYEILLKASIDTFYSDSNMNYLRSIKQDIKTGKANFAEHELIEVD